MARHRGTGLVSAPSAFCVGVLVGMAYVQALSGHWATCWFTLFLALLSVLVSTTAWGKRPL